LLKQQSITPSFIEKITTSPDHLAVPEFYVCPGGVPDLAKFPNAADLLARGLVEVDAPPDEEAPENPEAPEDPLTHTILEAPEEKHVTLEQKGGNA
jgi:hypothetical protein